MQQHFHSFLQGGDIARVMRCFAVAGGKSGEGLGNGSLVIARLFRYYIIEGV